MLPGTQTVVGVNCANLRYLQVERIGSGHCDQRLIPTDNLLPFVVCFNPRQKTLLAVNLIGHIKGFVPGKDASTWTELRLDLGPTTLRKSKHTDLNFEGVYTCDHFEALTVLAGRGLLLLDLAAQRVFRGDSARSAVGLVISARFCKVPDRLLLALGGEDPDYAEHRSDLLEVSQSTRSEEPPLGPSPEVAPGSEFGG